MVSRMKEGIRYFFLFVAIMFLFQIFIFSFAGSLIQGNAVLNSVRSIDSDNLHFDHMPITYAFVKDNESQPRPCQSYEQDRVRGAFRILQNSTNNIFCYFRTDIWFFFGKGGYTYTGNVINQGTLQLFTNRNCGTWPDVEIHELLHVLGFQHKKDEWSIMNPIQVRCDLGKIDDDIVANLTRIYG